jgi:hypothetical protein
MREWPAGEDDWLIFLWSLNADDDGGMEQRADAARSRPVSPAARLPTRLFERRADQAETAAATCPPRPAPPPPGNPSGQTRAGPYVM